MEGGRFGTYETDLVCTRVGRQVATHQAVLEPTRHGKRNMSRGGCWQSLSSNQSSKQRERETILG